MRPGPIGTIHLAIFIQTEWHIKWQTGDEHILAQQHHARSVKACVADGSPGMLVINDAEKRG